MNVPPEMFDFSRAAARRARARSMAKPGSGFLFELAADEIAGRLGATNREFRDAACLLCESKTLAGRLEARAMAVTSFSLDDYFAGLDVRLEGILAPQSRDLVVSVFGLHFVADLPGMLARIRRALRPDGLLLAALPGEGSFGELRASLIEAEAATGGAGLRVGPFADIRGLGALLQRAGFALPVADADRLLLRYGTPAALVADLRAAALTNPLAGPVTPLTPGIVRRAREFYREKFADPDGRVRATVNLVYLTGWAPDASQQQPMRPGTAKARLADALGGRKKRDS